MNGNEVAELRQLLVEFKASMDQRFDAMDQRFDRLEKKIDDLTDVVQAFVTGTAARFDALERKIDGRPPLTLVP